MSEIELDIAKQRFDHEVSHAESLDSKAGGLIGYSGVIATFIGFLFSANIISDVVNPSLLVIGIILTLLSITTGFIILIPIRKTRDVFLIEDFVNDIKNKTDEEKMDDALNAYLVLIDKAEKRNNEKAIILYVGNGLLG